MKPQNLIDMQIIAKDIIVTLKIMKGILLVLLKVFMILFGLFLILIGLRGLTALISYFHPAVSILLILFGAILLIYSITLFKIKQYKTKFDFEEEVKSK